MNYAELFFINPALTTEKLTPAVLEEIGRAKATIIADVLPYWKSLTGDSDPGVLAIELEGLTPNFIRALAQALAADPLARAVASLQMVLDPKKPADDDGEFDAAFEEDDDDEEDEKRKE